MKAILLATVLALACVQHAGAAQPVICLHGFNGDTTTFDPVRPLLEAAGLDPIALTYEPAHPDDGIAQTATAVVEPMIQEALALRGYPPDQPVAFLTHSTGSLVARVLVERGGWEARLTRMVMLSTPSNGARTGLGRHACALPRGVVWRTYGCDTRVDSPFLQSLDPPPADLTERYLSLSTEWRASLAPGRGDLDGDGRSHGNDGVVASESGYLENVPMRIWEGSGPTYHTRICCNEEVMKWAVAFLTDGTIPEQPIYPRRARAANLCRGGREPDDAREAVQTSVARATSAEAGLLRIQADATGATDALVQFKIRSARLLIMLDDEMLVDETKRTAPRGDLLHASMLDPGEHTLSVRWEVVFRSARDRHHPMGSGPDELGFEVPADGFARCSFQLSPEATQDVMLRFFRKPGPGVTGDTWVEFTGCSAE